MNLDLIKRRSGKTTGAILKAIGMAVEDPGTEIIYTDNIPPYKIAIDLIEKLQLNVYVERDGHSVRLKSLHEPVYESSDGHLYKRID
jgi:hypothetical protein